MFSNLFVIDFKPQCTFLIVIVVFVFVPQNHFEVRLLFSFKEDIESTMNRLPPHSRSGTSDAEIKDPFIENPGLKDSPFKAWSRSGYSHACFTYFQGFLP